jgi:hypothetical protein
MRWLWKELRDLLWNGRRVGVQLVLANGGAFHIWVDGDELYWGRAGALAGHDWPDGSPPEVGEKLQV